MLVEDHKAVQSEKVLHIHNSFFEIKVLICDPCFFLCEPILKVGKSMHTPV